ncbi:MAG: asparagine--tRNA ligase [bacterium JZ-2024 1]
MYIAVSELKEKAGEIVRVRGWLYNKRSSGKILFLLLRDGTGVVQCVCEEQTFSSDTLEEYKKSPLESSLEVEGKVREDPRAPGGVEILAHFVRTISPAQLDYPIQKKEHSPAFLMDYRHLWIRTPRQNAILRIRSALIFAIEQFLREKNFVRLDAPILTPSSCEGTTTLFEIPYFGDKAFLSQSGQLYMEAGAMALGKVYCFGPTFRAEKSHTRRHLTEFWMVEPEVAFMTFDELLPFVEEFFSSLVKKTLQLAERDFQFLRRDTRKLENLSPPFPLLTYDEAIEFLQKKKFPIQWGEDFGIDEETELSNSFDSPVFIIHYPAKCKAFYMKTHPENPELTLSLDLLAPEGYGEVIGGGQREDDFETLKRKIAEHNLPESSLQWYLDLRRFGSVPHSGFGLGLERTLAWLCKLEHIRESIPFPRTPTRIYP